MPRIFIPLATVALVATLLSACASGDSPPIPSGSAVPEAATTPTPTPTETITPFETDRFGVRYWDAHSDRSEVTYPDPEGTDEGDDERRWTDHQFITAECMDALGHDYKFKLWWELHPDDPGDPPVFTYGDDYYSALYGAPDSQDPADWTTQRCDGVALHRTGVI